MHRALVFCMLQDGLRLTLSPGGRDAPLAVGDTNRPNGLEASAAPPRPLAPRNMTCRLLLDCMGHYSDIVKQVRSGRVLGPHPAPMHSCTCSRLGQANVGELLLLLCLLLAPCSCGTAPCTS